MSMRELSLGEQDACRDNASQKIKSIVQSVRQKTSDSQEQRGLLKIEFDRRATESVRMLENFYPVECRERVEMRDEDMQVPMIKCALTNLFVIESLRDAIYLSYAAGEKSPALQECTERVQEEQQRFSVAYEVYKNKGIVTPETEKTLTERLKSLMVMSVPVFNPA